MRAQNQTNHVSLSQDNGIIFNHQIDELMNGIQHIKQYVMRLSQGQEKAPVSLTNQQQPLSEIISLILELEARGLGLQRNLPSSQFNNNTPDLSTLPSDYLPHNLLNNDDFEEDEDPFIEDLLKELGADDASLSHKNNDDYLDLQLRKFKSKLQEREKAFNNLVKVVEERKHEFIQQESYLNQALNQIDQIYFNIHDSLNYAKRFQEATLPRVESIKQKFNDSFILLKPKEVVSGDFYWFQQIDEDTLLIAALDCTGHGVPGAFMAMLGNELLDSIVNRQKIYEPHLILRELHRGVRMFLRQAENNNRDGMDGAICLIDKKQMQLEYAGAHNPILVIQNQDALLLSPNTFAIGGYEKEGKRNFTKQSIRLHPGASIYLYTDGYHDQIGGPDHRRFMASRLRRMLCKLYHKPMPEQKKILDKVIEYWMKGKPQLDDMLIMGLRI